MNTATIQVKYVNQPREAHWKSGSIKDAAGNRFSIAKEHLGYFQAGETCEVLWEQIGQYPTIVGKAGQPFPATPSQPAPGSAVPPSQPRNAQWPAPPQELTRVPDTPSDKEEGMFIMGVVGRAMGSGQFPMEQIPELTRVACHAWRTRHEQAETIPPAESPAHEARNPPGDNGPQLDDRIPF